MAGRTIIDIAYGRGTIPLIADPDLAEWTVIRPVIDDALPDANGAFRSACEEPVGCEPLREVIGRDDRVVIVTSDGTRPVPNRLLVPWILEEIPAPPERVTVLLGTGSHRPNSEAEIVEMFGPDVAGGVEIVNHDAFDHRRNECVGRIAGGGEVCLNRRYIEADRRIVVGFMEPHFFAGFSGGAKGVVPGVAGIGTILHIHRAALIADPRSTWGMLEENPLQREIREAVALCPPDFLLNVTLNPRKEITGFHAGHHVEAHRQGCAQVKKASMVPVPRPYPVVVTSNSGYPLDQNLYQTVKGISAAARIVEEGGTIFVASECSDGIPDHGNFADMMRIGATPADVLEYVFSLGGPVLDQWEAQMLASILRKADVAVHSTIGREKLEACKVRAVADLQSAIEERIRTLGRGTRIAVLPDGPLTIPFMEPEKG